MAASACAQPCNTVGVGGASTASLLHSELQARGGGVALGTSTSWPCPFIYISSRYFPVTTAVLGSCYPDHVACKASNIYSIALYRVC